jgi:hypothetical protein
MERVVLLMVFVVFSTVVSIGSGIEQLIATPKKANGNHRLTIIRIRLKAVFKLAVVII